MKRKSASPNRAWCSLLIAAAAITVLPLRAAADRRYFLESYTPYLAPAGQLEFETWLTALSGHQDPEVHTAWEQRFELEYAIIDRLTVAGYLNFSQPSGEPLHFDAPSLEFIYQISEPGRVLGDPAVYLETTENGEELELEPKLLLAHRVDRFVSAVNFVGEFEFRHNDEEKLEDGRVLHKEFKGEISCGIAYELSTAVALGLEARYREEYPNFDERAAAILSLGPSFNLQSRRVQLAIGVLPQIWGDPQTSGNKNFVDFEKTQVRAILGITL